MYTVLSASHPDTPVRLTTTCTRVAAASPTGPDYGECCKLDFGLTFQKKTLTPQCAEFKMKVGATTTTTTTTTGVHVWCTCAHVCVCVSLCVCVCVCVCICANNGPVCRCVQTFVTPIQPQGAEPFALSLLKQYRYGNANSSGKRIKERRKGRKGTRRRRHGCKMHCKQTQFPQQPSYFPSFPFTFPPRNQTNRKSAQLFKNNVILHPIGGDFRYTSLTELQAQLDSHARIMQYVRARVCVCVCVC